MRWAEEQGYIDRSPIAHMKKPTCGRKEQVVSPEQYQALLARYKDQEFKDLLTITWEVPPYRPALETMPIAPVFSIHCFGVSVKLFNPA